MKKKHNLLIFIFFHFTALSQNIIPNSSFEEIKRCPDGSLIHGLLHPYSNLSDCRNWFNPSKASPDYYNSCSKDGDSDLPKTALGFQYPNLGNAFVGIGYFYESNNFEYIEVKLQNKIKKKSRYCFSINVNIPDIATHSTDEIHFSLSKKKLKARGKKMIVTNNYFKIKSETVIKEKENWICFHLEISGDEILDGAQYLTIGWFEKNIKKSKITQKRIPHNKQNYIGDDIYFFIDDIILEEITDGDLCKCPSNSQTIEKKDK